MKKRTGRPGFALVTVIVLSAFLLVSIIGVGTVLTSQLQSQSQQVLSRKALYYAEAALQECFSAACDPNNTTIRTKLLNGTTYTGSWARSGDTGSVLSIIAPDDKQSFTVVKAKPVTVNSNKDFQFIAMAVICDHDISDLSVSDLQNGIGYTVLSRRIVQLGATGLSVPGGMSTFKYGMFAGTGIIQNGNSSYTAPLSSQSDPLYIYAGDSVNMKVTTFTGYVDIAAHNTINIGGGDNTTLAPHSAEMALPPINLAYQQSQFVAFLLGLPPYDGDTTVKQDADGNTYTDAGLYMDTAHHSIAGIINHYIPFQSVNISGYPLYFYTTPAQVSTLWHDLSNRTGYFTSLDNATWQQLVNTFAHTTFYVQDSATSLNATIGSDQYNGVMVIPGSLNYSNGAANAYTTAGVFLCNKNITFNGSGVYQGTFYTQGSFTQNGSTKGFYGSIIAGTGDIRLNGKGTIDLINYASGNLLLEDGFKVGLAAQSGWSETDLSAWTSF
jgi:hypothetical protein